MVDLRTLSGEVVLTLVVLGQTCVIRFGSGYINTMNSRWSEGPRLKKNGICARGVIILSLMGFLTACSNAYVGKEYGFRPVLVDTPAGVLSIKVKGVSNKTGKREWVTSGPWRLLLLLRSSSNPTDENCTVTVQNLSLFDLEGVSDSSAVQWDDQTSHFSMLNPEDEYPAAILSFPARDFEHRNYRLTFALHFSDQCSLAQVEYDVITKLDSFVETSKASLWDNLMGI